MRRTQSDTPGRRSHSWMKCDRGSRVSCWERHIWLGVLRRPGRSEALHHEGKPSVSLFGMMESEALDWKMAGTGSVRCRREPIVSPNTWSAGGKRTDCRGGKPNASPTARPKKNDGRFLHTKPRGVGVTDLIEESVFESGRYAFAVWSHLVAVKKLSSSQLEGQEQLGGAEVAGLLGRFRSTRLSGRWRGKGWPRAPQTAVEGGCAAWVPLLPEGSFLGRDCSIDKEEEGMEWSLVLLGINCLRAADCVLAERNFSTTELTASPNNPDCEMGASSRNTFSFSRISVRLSPKWRSAATEP